MAKSLSLRRVHCTAGVVHCGCAVGRGFPQLWGMDWWGKLVQKQPGLGVAAGSQKEVSTALNCNSGS